MNVPDLLGPLARKELGGFARRTPTYVSRMVYVGMIGALLYAHWSAVRVSNVSELAALSRRIFDSFFWLQLGWVSAVAVYTAADLMVREQRSGMLGLLALTPLDAEDVAWGKWKAAMGASLSLVLCGVPVGAICVYAGGVGPLDLAGSTGITGAAAALGAAFALRAAARSATLGGAIARSAFDLGKDLFLFGVLAVFFGPILSAPFHPFFAALAAAKAPAAFPLLGWVWVLTLPGCLWRTRRILLRTAPELKAAGFGGPVDAPADPRMGRMDPLTRFLYLGGMRQLEPPDWVIDAFPLVWKELVARAAGRAVRLWQTPVLIVVVPAALVFSAFSTSDAPGLAGAVHFVAVFIALAAGAGTFAAEREGRRWDGLLSAPIGSARIVGAKLLSPLLTPEAGALVVVVGSAIAGWGGLRRLEGGLPGAIGSSLLFLGFAYVLAAFLSLQLSSRRLAFVSSAALVVAFLGVSSTSLGPAWLRDFDPRTPLEGSEGSGVQFVAAYGAAILVLVAGMVGGLRRAAARTA